MNERLRRGVPRALRWVVLANAMDGVEGRGGSVDACDQANRAAMFKADGWIAWPRRDEAHRIG